MAEQEKRENWVRQDKDYSWYSAGGTREVIIFESEEPESRDVIHRKLEILTPDDKQRLHDEGIFNWTKDAYIMKAKYDMDKKIMKSVDFKEREPWNKQKVVEKILNLRNNLTEDGGKNIVLHLICSAGTLFVGIIISVINGNL